MKQLKIEFNVNKLKAPKTCPQCGGLILHFKDYAECVNRGWDCGTIYYFKDLNKTKHYE